MPQISIIIPVYNVEKYIGRCIDSIINQSFSDWELILVNDCSPDNSKKVIMNYTRKDSRIRYIEHVSNQGPMRARNNGIKASFGEYITFCDGDDTLNVDALDILYKLIISLEADIISGEILYIPLNGQTKLFGGRHTLKYGCDGISVMKSMLCNEYGHNLCAKLFKASLFKQYDYDTFDNCTNGEDGYLFYQTVVHANKVVHTNSIVYNYYQNLLSSSNRKFTINALQSEVKLINLWDRLSRAYPSLDSLFKRKMTERLCLFFLMQDVDELILNKILNDNDLVHYCTFISLLKNLGVMTTAKFYVKRCLLKINTNNITNIL